MQAVHLLLPTPLNRGFDYAVPEGMTLKPGDFVQAPFGSRQLPGVVWGEAEGAGVKLKTVSEHYAHLAPMPEAMRDFIDWAAWYTMSPKGAFLKMTLPVPEALKIPTTRERANLPGMQGENAKPALSPAQGKAADALTASLALGFSATLLDGVTGSGKTEVYFEAIEAALATGGQALVLLPEISLSVQWLARFEQRFGFAPLTWHSGLPPGKRKHTWRAIASGENRVVVGARSALFLPYTSLKLIVADEEHDSSYKQEDGVMYHARDMAVARARFEKIPVVLASATPSLETLHNARAGRYQELTLPARYGAAQLPEVKLVDMRQAGLNRSTFISDHLRNALAETLAKGEQSLLFLNRRGYAPLTLCRSCGHRFQCPQCTAWLVMHRRRMSDVGYRMSESDQSTSDIRHPTSINLLCHHCGYTIPMPERCPACQQTDVLHPCGPGVQRIAEEVAAFLPQARLGVLASDSADSQAELREHIQAMEEGRLDILIGTQMVAKGHHFGKLTLVGVVDADLGLSGGDLRAGERSFQLLHQVAGRAGREERPGCVLVQSFQPTHPVMQAIVSGDRARFMEVETEERAHGHWPPFSRLVALIIEGTADDEASRLARDLGRAAPRLEGVDILGPAPAPLFMLRGKFRYRLLLRARKDIKVQEVISTWLAPFKLPNSLRVKVDIDPMSFY